MSEPAFLLDSDICIYALLGRNQNLRRRMAEQLEGSIGISVISLAEVGVGYGAKFNEVEELQVFLGHVDVLPFDQAAAQVYAALPFKRGSFDRLIAAHALALDRTLVTNNEPDYAPVLGLRLENWTK